MIKKLRKFILNSLGLCEVCLEPLSKNIRNKCVCMKCKITEAIKEINNEPKVVEVKKNMTNKELAKLILSKVSEGQTRVLTIKNEIEELLKWVLQSIKDISGEIPDEKKFLDIVSEIIDELVKFPQPVESVDGVMIRQAIGLIDKYVLDKLLGKDWFEKLKSLIK